MVAAPAVAELAKAGGMRMRALTSSSRHSPSLGPPGSDPEPECVECEAPVATVSSIMARLQLPHVDVLKVDVEGDELDVLRGVDGDDWPKVRQVVAEVHDVSGRLQAVVDLLSSPAGGNFATVHVEAQRTSVVQDYLMVVPPELRLFYVYATRGPATAPARVRRRTRTQRALALARAAAQAPPRKPKS